MRFILCALALKRINLLREQKKRIEKRLMKREKAGAGRRYE
jgi:hypothetical protein